ncbi:NADP-dependent phosphogluconate dehydrogenase [Aerococcaceae bacterium DSM 111022]|nr:NADP-dependent phosphogluconate dehydrogenase [Aerococcaceae bacterium DSM 111022]
MSKAQIGVIGMAVMGKNLALNIESRGYSVGIFNRSAYRTGDVVKENPEKNLVPTYTLEDFVESLERPRRVLIMIQAGSATDDMIKQITPLLDDDDVLVDCGNTYFEDTMRRAKELEGSGIHFVGMGVSGGEEGALLGPSLMPGGPKEAYDILEPILKEIAAKAPSDGEPCVAHIGTDGAGHYVKMVHNGIEYGDMQLIAESYDIMRRHLGLSVEDIAGHFAEWNKGELDSFLIEITADILTKYDPETGKPMVDVILDRAGNKGTGKWTSQSSLDLGIPLSTITESVFARFISAMKDERVTASEVLSGPGTQTVEASEELVEKIRQALYFSKIMSYAQGFVQYREASKEYGWDLDYKEIAKIFRAGCIIRAQFLEKIMDAYDANPELDNILLDPYFKDIADKYQQATRDVAAMALQAGIPVPGFTSALAYYDSYRTPVLPANIIQAQRDYFGAHTYERVDKEGTFHFLWNEGKEEDWS